MLRHRFDEYLEATRKRPKRKTSLEGGKNGQSVKNLAPRARRSFRWTDFQIPMTDEHPDGFRVVTDDGDPDYWQVSLFIRPIGAAAHLDGIDTPVSMAISKLTGQISDLQASPAF